MSLIIVDVTRGICQGADGFQSGQFTAWLFGVLVNKEASSSNSKASAKPQAAEFALNTWQGHRQGLHEQLRGQYFFVVHDSFKRQLSIHADWLGTRPAYWHHDGAGRLIVGVHAGEVAKAANDTSLSKSYIQEMLISVSSSEGATPYANVHKHWRGVIEFRAGSHSVVRKTTQRYSYPADIPLPKKLSETEAIKIFAAQLNTTISNFLAIANSPVFELSGGLDTSTVVAFARNHVRGPFAFLTWAERRSEIDDDLRFARLVAQQQIARHYVLKAPPNLLTEWGGDIKGFDEPGMELAPYSCHILACIVKKYKFDAILTGVGGDNAFGVFGGDPYWLETLLRNGEWIRLAKLIGKVMPDGTRHRSGIPLVAKYAFAPLIGLAIYRNWSDCFWQNVSGVISNRLHYDRHLPVEALHPLLDVDLLRLGCALQARFNPVLQPDRYLHRKMIRGMLPDEVVDRKGKGSSVPREVQAFASGKFLSKMRASDSMLVELGFIRAERWTELMSQAACGHFISLSELRKMIQLEVWLRQFRETDIKWGQAAT